MGNLPVYCVGEDVSVQQTQLLFDFHEKKVSRVEFIRKIENNIFIVINDSFRQVTTVGEEL